MNRLLCLSLLLPLAASAQHRVALVMGNQAYHHAQPLRCPAQDAADMESALTAAGFTVLGGARSGVNLSRAQMISLADDFLEEARGAETALLYFSGHGMLLADEDTRDRSFNYLLPVETRLLSDKTSEIQSKTVSVQSILEGMDTAGARAKIVILDACQNNGLAAGKSSGHLKGGAGAESTFPKDSFLALASSPGTTADDGRGAARNSPFTAAILHHLPEGLPLPQLFAAVQDSVEASGARQTPLIQSRLSAATIGLTLVKSTLPSATEAAQQRTAELAAMLAGRDAEIERLKRAQTAAMIPATPSPSIPPPASSLQSPASSLQSPHTNSLGMRFVPVPGAKPLFSVWETRVKDFAAFVQDARYDYAKGLAPYTLTADGWKQSSTASWQNPGFPQTDEHPVTCVSWEDAQAFCAWLSKKEGRTYRLPTDHEWSLAAGIGARENPTATPQAKDEKIEGVYPWGTTFPPPPTAGNYAGSESKIAGTPASWSLISGFTDRHPRTAPVGSYATNSLGLLDLGGNVWEWCQDFYDGKSGSRVLRGGSWFYNTEVSLRSSHRYGDTPTGRGDYSGFRVVLEVGSGG